MTQSMLRKRVCAFVALVFVISVSLVATPAFAAVTVESLAAQAQSGKIVVNWKTATEISNAGFNLYRKNSANGSYTKVAGLIPSQALGSINGASYSYSDSQVNAGQTYYYRLQSVSNSGGTQDFDADPVTFGQSPTATATRTNAPTSTRTKTPVPQNTSTPTTVPKTATRTPVASATSLTATPPAPWTVGSAQATKPQTKVAMYVPDAAATRASQPGISGAPTPPPAPQMDAVPAKVDEGAESSDSNPPGDYSAETATSTGSSLFMAVAVYTLSGLFGCGSLLFGLLAIYMWLRVSMRR